MIFGTGLFTGASGRQTKNMAQRRMSVIDVLEKLDDGGALEDLREAIAQVNHALAQAPTKSKGSVTLKINFSKISKSELHIVDEVTSKVPKKIKDPNVFYATPDGGLSRDNPDQGRLGIADDLGVK